MSQKLLLTFCLLFALFTAAAQQRDEAHLDSLQRVLQHRPDDSAKVEDLFSLALQYIEVNPITGIRCAQQMQQIALTINFRMGQGDAWLALAGNEQAMSAYPAAHSHYFIALSIYEDIGFEDGAATALVDIGMLYDNESNQKKALDYELKGLAITRRLGRKKNMVQILLNIGSVYYNMGDKAQSLNYTTQAWQLATENKDVYGVITTEGSLANIYIENGNYAQGFHYLFSALRGSIAIGDKRIIAENYGNIGGNYLMIADSSNVPNDSLIPAGKAARLQAGIQYLTLALTASSEIDAKDLLINDYKSLAEAKVAGGDYKAAFEAQRLYADIKDSVFTTDNKETIKNLEDKRELDLRDKQLKITALQLAVQNGNAGCMPAVLACWRL